MSVQLKYNGFIINKLNYEYKGELEQQQDSFYLEFMFDDISVAISANDAIVTLSGHANCSNEENDNDSEYRTLNIKVDYFYDIENPKKVKSPEKIKKIVNNYGVNNAIILFQELVKQITSLDIVGPISSYEFRFPGSLK